jgi:hypothetical protein
VLYWCRFNLGNKRLQLFFPRYAFVLLGGIPNPIFERTLSLWELCGDHIGSPRRINPTRCVELNHLSKMEFMCRHLWASLLALDCRSRLHQPGGLLVQQDA